MKLISARNNFKVAAVGDAQTTAVVTTRVSIVSVY